jgi:hypothetical protein
MKKSEVRESILEYVESEIGEVEMTEFIQDDPSRYSEVVEAFKNACEAIYDITVDDDKLEDVETVRDVLDDCVDAVIVSEGDDES